MRNMLKRSTLIGALATCLVAAGALFGGETTLLSESFENAVVTGYAENTVPATGWVGATQGYGATWRGLYNEGDGSVFTTPHGDQVYKLRYTNSGLTTAEGTLGSLTADTVYTISFTTAVETGTAESTYRVEFVAFDPGANRTECRDARPGVQLIVAQGTVSSSDMSKTVTIYYVATANDPLLGKDIGVRLIKRSGVALYDNITVVARTGATVKPIPAASVTSPVCIEGDTIDGDVSVSTDGTNYTAIPTQGLFWYTDVALNPGAATDISVKYVSLQQQGSVIGTGQVTWTPTDIAATSAITIRKGDSLLLTANGTGALEIDADYDGTTFTADHTGTAGDTFAQAFATAGTTTVKAQLDGVDAGTLVVTVVETTLQDKIGVLVDTERTIEATVNGGTAADVNFASSHDFLLTVGSTATGSGADLDLNASVDQTPAVVARLGANGPVLAARAVDAMSMTRTTVTQLPVIKEFTDGTMLVALTFEIYQPPPGYEIKLQVNTGGSVFEESGINVFWMPTANFDRHGQQTVYMITSATSFTCHVIGNVREEGGN